MDKEEITAEATKIGSYPISIIPDQDCCTLFTPRNPATRARLADVEAAEQALPIDDLVALAVKGAVLEYSEFPAATKAAGEVGSKRRDESPESGAESREPRAKEEV
jgi:hypothetical protein